METPFNQTPLGAEQLAALADAANALSRDQLLWASGYYYGLAQSGVSAAPVGVGMAAAKAVERNLTILFGTESGNSEALAAEAGKRAKARGWKAKVTDMADFEPTKLKAVENVLLIASTWGEGDPPERALGFWDKLAADGMPKLEGLRYSVLSLGDTSYEHFCKFGKDLDYRLEALGAERIAPRIDSDVDYEAPFKEWLESALSGLEAGDAPAAVLDHPAVLPVAAAEPYSKKNPFPAEVLEKINLNGTGSAKETIHLELSLAGSGLDYEPGDALGVFPVNNPALVEEILSVLKLDGNARVELEAGEETLREVLGSHFDICTLSKPTLEKYASVAENTDLDALMADQAKVKAYAEGRLLVDLFTDFPAHNLTPARLVSLLRKLPARLYSIASSLRAHPDEVHLTVGAVRYTTHGKEREGVCSTYMADRLEVGGSARIYVHKNKNFRLPDDLAAPVIMVGPGTGIAPFRAFVEERAARGATGPSWLFFGDQHYTTDFLYQLEWQDHLKDGNLSRLDVAFSRDQPEKIYVQDRMLENSAELYAWLEKGAYFYVCGDASRMAKDVAAALEKIVEKEGKMEAAAAREYLKRLKKEKRIQQDVY